MYYIYRFRGALYLMQTGFDPVHARLKPGHVLLGWIVEQAIGEGYRVLDFLSGSTGTRRSWRPGSARRCT